MKLFRIRFPDQEAKRRGLGFLAGRFSFTSFASGEVLVVESALTAFAVEGPATYAEASPHAAFADTLLELEQRFGAVSSESQTIAGQ